MESEKKDEDLPTMQSPGWFNSSRSLSPTRLAPEQISRAQGLLHFLDSCESVSGSPLTDAAQSRFEGLSLAS